MSAAGQALLGLLAFGVAVVLLAMFPATDWGDDDRDE